jgi:hypothetical protein
MPRTGTFTVEGLAPGPAGTARIVIVSSMAPAVAAPPGVTSTSRASPPRSSKVAGETSVRRPVVISIRSGAGVGLLTRSVLAATSSSTHRAPRSSTSGATVSLASGCGRTVTEVVSVRDDSPRVRRASVNLTLANTRSGPPGRDMRAGGAPLNITRREPGWPPSSGMSFASTFWLSADTRSTVARARSARIFFQPGCSNRTSTASGMG